MRVSCYRNLRTKNFSIQHKGKVIGHSDSIQLEDVEFRVSTKGRGRVRETGQKNVHAKVWGTLKYHHVICDREVYYNPYKCDTFQLLDGTPVYEAKYCVLMDNKVYIP